MPSHANQVRLHEALVGGTGGRETRESVLAHLHRIVVIRDGADSDDVGRVTGRADRHGRRSIVAGGGYDHDAGRPRSHDGLVEGIGPIR